VLFFFDLSLNNHTWKKEDSMSYAKEFSEIIETIKSNSQLLKRIVSLIATESIPGKVLEGEGRLDSFKVILSDYFEGKYSINETISEVEFRLARQYSAYENDNRVFAKGWAERLTRTQVSRFYNQAVLSEIIEDGGTECFVAHSSSEGADSKCSQQLAGSRHSASVLLDRLVSSYRDGNWGRDVKIPDHPHCTHTVQPV
jgi:hypothetical protein